MNKLVNVITSITGPEDTLRDDQANSGEEFVAFVDRRWNSKVWSERPAYDHFKSARRNSRAPKILPHLFVNAEYSLWIDGTVSLRVPVGRLIDEWLSSADIAVFRHFARDCIYDEARVCIDRRLDNPVLIEAQIAKYQQDGFPTGGGLAECTVILRRHSDRMEEFNQLWWSEFCRYSVRDQISFSYAAQKCGLTVKYIDPTKMRHPYFSIIDRRARPEPY